MRPSAKASERPPLFQVQPLGDAAIVVTFGERIDEETFRCVRRLSEALEDDPFPGMIECVPAFATVTIYYDAARLLRWQEKQGGRERGVSPYRIAERRVQGILTRLRGTNPSRQGKTVEVPVCYGGEFGPDLEAVAEHNGLSPEDVVRLHSGVDYLVYMLGFAPGFAYLGGMSERIAAPRRRTPRLSIPAGAVGIAGNQTGVYPIASPGGWQLIGRTPMGLFLPASDPPSRLAAGDTVRFYPISRQEFDRWEDEAE